MSGVYEREQAALKSQNETLQMELDAFKTDSTRAENFLSLVHLIAASSKISIIPRSCTPHALNNSLAQPHCIVDNATQNNNGSSALPHSRTDGPSPRLIYPILMVYSQSPFSRAFLTPSCSRAFIIPSCSSILSMFPSLKRESKSPNSFIEMYEFI